MDIDMYDAYADKKEEEPKKSSRQPGAAANGVVDSTKSTGSTSRKAAVVPDDGKASNNSHAIGTTKESHTNGSTIATGSAASTTSNPSKKRKAPAQSASSSAHKDSHASASGASGASVAIGTRRSTTNQTVVPTGRGYKETNMLTFEKSRAVLVDGKLIADDGTELGTNGMDEGRALFCFLFPPLLTLPSPALDAMVADLECRSCISHLRTTRRAILHSADHGIPARRK